MGISPKSPLSRSNPVKTGKNISLHAKLARGRAIPKAKPCPTCGK